MKIKQIKSYMKTDKIFKRKMNLKLKQLQEILAELEINSNYKNEDTKDN